MWCIWSDQEPALLAANSGVIQTEISPLFVSTRLGKHCERVPALSFRLILAVFAVFAFVAGAVGFFAVASLATVEFSFAAPGDSLSMIYRCRALETPSKTEENARAAHGFFAPALIEASRLQGELMAQSMSPTRSSSEIIPELEQVNAMADARRKELQVEMQSRFGCSYRGSI